jgi:hypothetical protein
MHWSWAVVTSRLRPEPWHSDTASPTCRFDDLWLLIQLLVEANLLEAAR